MLKKIFVISFTFFLVLAFSSSVFAQDEAPKEVKKEVKKEVVKEKEVKSVINKSSVDKVFNTICPVSGEETDDSFTSTYEGKTYSLCCKRCVKKFEADPAKYSKNLNETGNKFQKQK